MTNHRKLSRFVIPCSYAQGQIASEALDIMKNMQAWEAATKTAFLKTSELDTAESFIKHCIDLRIERTYPPETPVNDIDPTLSRFWQRDISWVPTPSGLHIDADTKDDCDDVFVIVEAMHTFFDFEQPTIYGQRDHH